MIYIHIPVYFQQEGWKIVRCCQNWLLWNWDVFGGFRECKLAKIHFKSPPSIITQIMHKKNWLSWLGRGHGWCGLRRQIQANLPYWQLAHPQVGFVQCFSSSILKIWFFKDYASWCLERQIHELQRQGYLIVFMLMFRFQQKKYHNCLNDTDGGKQPKMRPGWYRSGGLKFKQHMVYQVFTHH